MIELLLRSNTERFIKGGVYRQYRNKMVNKKEMKVEQEAGGNPYIIEIDGEKYIFNKVTTHKKDKVEHADKIMFKKFNEDEYKNDFKTIIDCLSKKTTTAELLSEIIKNVTPKDLKRLAKRIRGKKLIIKHKGCLGFKIGDAYLELFS